MAGIINFNKHNELTVQQQHRRLGNVVKAGGLLTVGLGVYSAAKCPSMAVKAFMLTGCVLGGVFVNHMGNVIYHIGEQPDAESFDSSLYWQLGLLSTMPVWAAGMAKAYQVLAGTPTLEDVITGEEEI